LYRFFFLILLKTDNSVQLLTVYFSGAFSWDEDPLKQFDWHPLLMTLAIFFGMVILLMRPSPLSVKLFQVPLSVQIQGTVQM
jgi:hypothetical protein